MNYLSHLFFSQRTPLSFTGNLMGDFKPDKTLLQKLPMEILLGIENHRFVDKTTDVFTPVKDLKPLFSKDRRRFAGVLTDIVFDYFLIKHWPHFTQLNFDDFVHKCYDGLHQCQVWMPERMSLITQKMIEHDWLRMYATLEGVAMSIDQVSKRIRFENKMAGAIVEIETHYAEIEVVFMALFTHLKQQVAERAIETVSGDLSS